MAGKKNSIETKKVAPKKEVSEKDIAAHPFETDSQIETVMVKAGKRMAPMAAIRMAEEPIINQYILNH